MAKYTVKVESLVDADYEETMTFNSEKELNKFYKDSENYILGYLRYRVYDEKGVEINSFEI